MQAGAPEGASHDNVWKCFTKKNWKVFWNIFPFLHRWIWCDEKIKEYVTFYAYFSRMQNVFILDVESFFLESCFFSGKKLVLFQRFLSIFFQRWLMIAVQHIWFHPFLLSFFDATWTLTYRSFGRIPNECVQKKTLFQFLCFTLERY